MNCKRIHRCPYGAEPLANGSVRFRLWAPAHRRVFVQLAGNSKPLPMLAFDHGWHELVTYEARSGSHYCFVLPDNSAVPDPASRFQPQDVSGPSEVIDPEAYQWHDESWRGRPWHEAVIYELHVGSFSNDGTFRGVIEHLPHLTALGVTTLSLMPVADFPGQRNWGYDCALPFAPDSSYGRPEDLKALVDAAHAHRLTILLDVVYNHFGPLGNYLHSYAPQFFNDRQTTPWGPAINLDGPNSRQVRDFIIHNALYWLEEFHFDGLRLDAVHAMVDRSDQHLVMELAERVRATLPHRHVHLLLENAANQANFLHRDAEPPLIAAQWNDDVHHVLHAAATMETAGYYREYQGDTDKLGRALAEGFAFQGETMQFTQRPRGEPSAHLPPTAFVAFIQNHDQVGNRPGGERIGHLTSSPALQAISALYLLLPQIPMLFMGEEWQSSSNFPYFCDFKGQLADAIRAARIAEYATEPGKTPFSDPTAATTFAAAKLDWKEIATAGHTAALSRYRRLLQCRRSEIVPLLPHIAHGGRFDIIAPNAVIVRWQAGAHTLVLIANLSPQSVELPHIEGRVLWQEGDIVNDRADQWAIRYLIA